MGILRYQFVKFCFNLRSEIKVKVTWRQNVPTMWDCGKTHRGACSFEGKEDDMLRRDSAWSVWVLLECRRNFGDVNPQSLNSNLMA